MIKGTFLVVGGNSGIGKAVVDILVSKGHSLVICDKEISEDLSKRYPCYKVDLCNRENVDHFCQNVLSKLEINNLVYSAGYQENVDILDLDIDLWESMFRVNVGSAFSISQIIARNVERDGYGVLAYISSVHGEIIREIPHYSASKAAQNMMMKEFAYRLAAFGGRAFSIAPGSIDTPMLRRDLCTEELFSEGEKNIPMKRHGSATEVARLLYNLLEVDYLTGTVVVLDGGLSLII